MLRRSVFTNPVTDLSMCIGGTVVACLLLLETPTRGQATGDMPYLVKNIDASGSSEPGEFVQVGRFTYFRAHDGVHGSELWRTDGTEEGTSLVTDINAGEASSFPSDLIGFKAKLFFTARTDEAGREVWSTDGSAEGTGLLGDINPGSSDGVDAFQRLFVPFGDTLYFRGQDLAGIELWKTDGTPEGTVLVGDIHPGAQWSVPIYLAPLRGRVYFSADDKYTPELLAFDRELWTTDGTSRGTFV